MRHTAVWITLLLSTVAAAQTRPTTGPEEMVSYEATGRHFRLQYPQSWLRQAHGWLREAHPDSVAVTLRAERQLQAGNLAHTVAVAEEEPHRPPASLDALAASTLRLLTQQLPGATISAATDTHLGNLPAKKFVASYSPSGLDVQVLEVVAFDGNHVFTVTYTAEKSSYDAVLPAVEAILESFEVSHE